MLAERPRVSARGLSAFAAYLQIKKIVNSGFCIEYLPELFVFIML